MSEYKLAEKAYEINLSKIDNCYMYEREIEYAETIGKAKSKLFNEAIYNGMRLYSGDELTYTNIPVIRAKDYDKYEFDGKTLIEHKINQILHERERISGLNAILENEDIKFCYIYKGGYYRPNSCGYTDFKSRAGVFTKEEAVSNAKSCSDLRIIPINIDEHNEMINKEINELKTRMIS